MHIKLFSAVLMISIIMTPASAYANVHYGEAYESMSTEEKVAYLYGMIAQLQMLLELMLEMEDDDDRGSSSSSRSDVEVETLSAQDIEHDEAELRGRVDLDGEDEALVWFEYGEDDDDLDERTSKRRITDSSGDVRTFSTTIDDLDDDERYYYRAVAEDENGDRDYGSVRSFTTDDRYDDDDDDDPSSSNGDFELTVSDTSIDEGDRVEVDWEIPSDETGSQNWIGLYRVGASNSSYVKWAYIDNDDTGTESFVIDDEGDYEFRLFLSNSYNVEVESDTVEVN